MWTFEGAEGSCVGSVCLPVEPIITATRVKSATGPFFPFLGASTSPSDSTGAGFTTCSEVSTEPPLGLLYLMSL